MSKQCGRRLNHPPQSWRTVALTAVILSLAALLGLPETSQAFFFRRCGGGGLFGGRGNSGCNTGYNNGCAVYSAPASAPAATMAPAGTLWDRLGGEKNVRKVIDDFVALAAPDPNVDFFRGGKFPLDAAGVAKLKQLLVEQVSAVSGGPFKYSGRSMEETHKGMNITQAQFLALAGHLKTAMEKNGAKPADVQAVLGVIGGTAKDIVGK